MYVVHRHGGITSAVTCNKGAMAVLVHRVSRDSSIHKAGSMDVVDDTCIGKSVVSILLVTEDGKPWHTKILQHYQ